MYFSILNTIALWLYAWVIPFCLILFNEKIELFVRGLLIITITVFFCAIGSEVVVKKYPVYKEVVTNLSLMLTLTAGGLGGNFMSHALIKMEGKNSKK